ncbi:hypothetical protein S83_029061, partial [Arachis hypogaea]
MKYRQRVLGLILVSPLCKEPSWTEWLCNKVMSNLLYFCGMCRVAKEMLLKRYYSKDIRGSAQFPESDIVKACRRKKLLEKARNDAKKKYDEINEQNKILHSHLEALHIRKAKKERNAASISFGSSSADTFGDAGLQTVMTCLRNSKEI